VARLGATANKAPKPAKTAGAAPKGRPSGGAFVGLDIGTYAIKAVEVKGFRNGLTVTAQGIAPTPPGTIQNGIVSDPKALGAAIKGLLQKSGIKAKKAISAAAGADGVVVRVIEVAPMSPSELREMMKWEVERHIPFSANDIEMSYQAIDPEAAVADPNNPTMEVLLAVARREMIGLHLNTIEAAGLTPVAIDIEPLAVGRTLLDLDKKGLANKNVVIVNVGASITDVGVYKNGILRFPRTIPIAGENFTRAIADQLGITMEAAEEEKRQDAVVLMEMLGSGSGSPGIDTGPAEPSPFDFDFETAPPSSGAAFDLPGTEPAPASAVAEDPLAGGATFDPYGNVTATPQAGTPPTPPPPPVPTSSGGHDPNDPRYRRRREIFDALLPVLGEFSMEIRRSIDYFRSRYPTDTVDQILLCGGSARIGNLDQYVQYEMGIPTMVADPFANVTTSSKQMSGQRLSEVAPAFTVALGLAARDAVLGPG